MILRFIFHDFNITFVRLSYNLPSGSVIGSMYKINLVSNFSDNANNINKKENRSCV